MPRARCLPSPRCCLPRTRAAFQCAIAFFFSLYAFCHLADLRFSFFFFSFSHQARVLRPQQSLSADEDASSATLRPAPRSHGGTRREHRRALERKISLRRRGYRQRFSSKHSTTARELRLGARGRCPRRGEEEALRIDKYIVKPRA